MKCRNVLRSFKLKKKKMSPTDARAGVRESLQLALRGALLSPEYTSLTSHPLTWGRGRATEQPVL